jgi:hypothetical protein
VLPYSENAPTRILKFLTNNLVTLLVSAQFTFPKNLVGGWNTAVNRTTMPEAAINENGQLHSWKDKVRATKN